MNPNLIVLITVVFLILVIQIVARPPRAQARAQKARADRQARSGLMHTLLTMTLCCNHSPDVFKRQAALNDQLKARGIDPQDHFVDCC